MPSVSHLRIAFRSVAPPLVLALALGLGLAGCAGTRVAQDEPEPCPDTLTLEACLEQQMLEEAIAAHERRRRQSAEAMMERQRYFEYMRTEWMNTRDALR